MQNQAKSTSNALFVLYGQNALVQIETKLLPMNHLWLLAIHNFWKEH